MTETEAGCSFTSRDLNCEPREVSPSSFSLSFRIRCGLFSAARKSQVGCVGGLERIRATPLPFVYVAHLRTFLVRRIDHAPVPQEIPFARERHLLSISSLVVRQSDQSPLHVGRQPPPI